MKYFLTIILCALCTNFSTAQYVQAIEVQSLIPPEIKIDFGNKDAAIVAVHYYKDIDRGVESELIFDSTLVNTIAIGIKNSLEESLIFSESDLQIYNLYSDTTMLTKPLNADELFEIGEEADVNTVIAIQFANIISNYTYGRDKTKPLVTNVSFTVLINTYDVNTGAVLNRHYVKDKVRLSAEYDNDGNYYAAPTQEEAKKITAEMIGEDFTKRIVPNWQTVERLVFYNPTNANLNKAYNYVAQTQNWESAIECWTKELGQQNSKSGEAQVMYNMALGCEMMGQFDLSLKWLEKAKNLGSNANKYIDDYAKVIRQRIDDKSEIDDLYQNF